MKCECGQSVSVANRRHTIYWPDSGPCLQFSGVATRQRPGPLSLTAHFAY